jgi:hypothetical protein
MSYEEQRQQYLADVEAKRWCRYVPQHERPVLGKLIKWCLEGGNRISVYDGEEYVVKRSQSFSDIKCMLGHSGEDVLVVRDDVGDYLGEFNLIYSNGSHGDPLVVISDYSCNAFCGRIVERLEERYGS